LEQGTAEREGDTADSKKRLETIALVLLSSNENLRQVMLLTVTEGTKLRQCASRNGRAW
jgi:hypothetical protein